MRASFIKQRAIDGRGIFYSGDAESVAKAKGLDINKGVGSGEYFTLRDTICNDVFLIKLTPGLNPTIFDMLLEMKYKGIVNAEKEDSGC